VRSTRSSNDDGQVPDDFRSSPPVDPKDRICRPPRLNVGQRRGWNAVLGNGFPERGEHDGAGDPVVGGDREGVAGAVVEPGQDLGVGARASVGATEPVVDIPRHSGVNRRMSTWLGHSDAAHTYWYLTATGELMTLAAGMLEPDAEREPS
jgi:hypothetical protein